MKIKFISAKRVDKNFVVGTISVSIEDIGLNIYEILVMMKDTRWIRLPTRSYANGTKRYYLPYLQFEDDDIASEFDKEVLALWDEFEKGGKRRKKKTYKKKVLEVKNTGDNDQISTDKEKP